MENWIPTTDILLLRRMGKLIEELSELQYVAARCIIQGIDHIDVCSGESNVIKLQNEIADVLAQCDKAIVDLNLDRQLILSRKQRKIEQTTLFDCGVVKPN